MVTALEAVILGIIQGITEWLPVSSSAHLMIAEKIFSINAENYYSLLLHLGTLVVIIGYFWKDVWQIITSLVFLRYNEYTELFFMMLLATIPIAVVGYFFI